MGMYYKVSVFTLYFPVQFKILIIMNQTPHKKATKNKHLPLSTMLIIDLISFVFSLLPNIVAFGLTGVFLYHTYHVSWFALLVSPIVLLGGFVLSIFLLRICLPNLKPGRYKKELNKAVVSWFCHFALGRAAKISGMVRVLQTFNITKFLYWRALGAKVSFYITNSYDIDFVDSPLIKIGKGVTIGSETSISCHADIGNCLILGKVIVEDNVFIAMSCTIGPNTTIKKNAWIGFGNPLTNETIGEGEKLKNIDPKKPVS